MWISDLSMMTDMADQPLSSPTSSERMENGDWWDECSLGHVSTYIYPVPISTRSLTNRLLAIFLRGLMQIGTWFHLVGIAHLIVCRWNAGNRTFWECRWQRNISNTVSWHNEGFAFQSDIWEFGGENESHTMGALMGLLSWKYPFKWNFPELPYEYFISG